MADGRVVARRAVAVATGLEAREDLLADLGLATTELQLGGIVEGTTCPPTPPGLQRPRACGRQETSPRRWRR